MVEPRCKKSITDEKELGWPRLCAVKVKPSWAMSNTGERDLKELVPKAGEHGPECVKLLGMIGKPELPKLLEGDERP
jgi:hypothetical protein